MGEGRRGGMGEGRMRMMGGMEEGRRGGMGEGRRRAHHLITRYDWY